MSLPLFVFFFLSLPLSVFLPSLRVSLPAFIRLFLLHTQVLILTERIVSPPPVAADVKAHTVDVVENDEGGTTGWSLTVLLH